MTPADPHQVRVIRPHNETSPDWNDYHEMVLVGRPNDDGPWTQYEIRDAIGRRHPHAWRRWHIAICNNTECRAEMIVQFDAVVGRFAEEVGL